MLFDYNASKPPVMDFLGQMEILRGLKVDNPEAILVRDYVIISKYGYTQYYGNPDQVESEYTKYYKDFYPIIQLKLVSIDHRHTGWLIVMQKDAWDFVKNMYDGDLNEYFRRKLARRSRVQQ